MKIPKNYDVVNNTPSIEKAQNGIDYDGIKPNGPRETPGEKASNDPGARSFSKGSPLKGGAGYVNGK